MTESPEDVLRKLAEAMAVVEKARAMIAKMPEEIRGKMPSGHFTRSGQMVIEGTKEFPAFNQATYELEVALMPYAALNQEKNNG